MAASPSMPLGRGGRLTGAVAHPRLVMPLIPGHSTKASQSSRQPSLWPRLSLVEDRCRLSPLTLPFSSQLQPGQAAGVGRQGLSSPREIQSSWPPWNTGFLGCRWGRQGQSRENKLEVPQGTSAGRVPIWFQNLGGHSFNRLLTYLHLPRSSPSLQLHAFLAQPCLESLLLLSPTDCPPHSTICKSCWIHLLNTSQMLPSHHRHCPQPRPSLEMHLLPH